MGVLNYWHPLESPGDIGGVYDAVYDAAEEYNKFRRCLPQLIDADDPITGDLSGRWVIFKDGWVYGLASYATEPEAIKFGRRIFIDEPHATFIIAQVDLELHGISPLHLLADSISELEFEE